MMYRHCIYCSANLGANQAIENFPVGRHVAFDAEKGRLWAVCARCARWNLAPIEERWEAVEEAEKRFADCRLRVQSENIGLARLPDGTRLVRIGKALRRELAAWRYGAEFRRRHRWFWPAVAATATMALLHVLPLGAFAPGLWFAGAQWAQGRRRVIRLPAAQSPTGAELDVRGIHVAGAVVKGGAAPGSLQVQLPMEGFWSRIGRNHRVPDAPLVTLEGDAARRTVERAMPLVNGLGGSRKDVEAAVATLAESGTAEALTEAWFMKAGVRLSVLGVASSHRTGGVPAPVHRALALEMALHEESERRALQGELTLLESAWREAEALADIADRLSDPALA
ncbi:MAG TPA: hypothetical protein VFJ16_20770 [Longimicrobium sp.]|nr:hypothetical protein [Longimicrobium sp.]